MSDLVMHLEDAASAVADAMSELARFRRNSDFAERSIDRLRRTLATVEDELVGLAETYEQEGSP